jgi:hypothetical protein
MADGEGAGGPPTAGAAPVAVPALPFVTGWAACGTVYLACLWAIPQEGDLPGVFLAKLALFALLTGVPLVRFASVRPRLACLPLVVVRAVRGTAAFLSGGWAGGGRGRGGCGGGLAGRLFAWEFVGILNSPGATRYVTGGQTPSSPVPPHLPSE